MTGFVLLAFVVIHLAGNLLAFAGSTMLNGYAHALRAAGSPVLAQGVLLNLARGALAASLATHLGAHVWILLRGSASGSGAGGYLPVPPWYAAFPLPVLLASGGVLALFLVLHLAQLTFGAGAAFDPADPYGNAVRTLRSWPVALAYLAAAAAVGVHVFVGTWTGMRSLRLVRPGTERLARGLAPAVALAVTAGLAATPAAVLFGWLS